MMGLEYEAYAPVPEIGQGTFPQGEDVGAVYGQASGIGRKEGSQDLQQGGFSRSGSAHDGHHLGRFYAEIHSLEHFQRTKTLANILGLNNHFHYLCTPHKDRNNLAKAQPNRPAPAASVLDSASSGPFIGRGGQYPVEHVIIIVGICPDIETLEVFFQSSQVFSIFLVGIGIVVVHLSKLF